MSMSRFITTIVLVAAVGVALVLHPVATGANDLVFADRFEPPDPTDTTTPWVSRLHFGPVQARTEATSGPSVTVEWPETGADYTLYLTTDPDMDIGDRDASDVITVENAESPHVFEDLVQGENVYIALLANDQLQSWTAARPSVVGFGHHVQDIAIDETTGTQYIGGFFNTAGMSTGSGITLPLAHADDPPHLLAFPEVAGDILVSEPDGDGGWYIGGEFTHVQGQARTHLAHIDAQGRLTDWNPDVAGGTNITRVLALTIAEGIVYVGGEFYEINGHDRLNLAAIDTDGNLTDWDPQADNFVFALAAHDGVIYAGGYFNNIGEHQASMLAALDTDGNLTDWTPDDVTGSGIMALLVADDIVYVGGGVTSIDGQTRNRLAAMDTDGNLTDWNPNVRNGQVRALAEADGIIYVGGTFDTIDGVERNLLAAIDTNRIVTGWDPDAGPFLFHGGEVNALAVADGVVYAGGYFDEVGGQERANLAAIDADIDTGGQVLDWDAGIDNFVRDRVQSDGNTSVNALALGEGVLYAGGGFRLVGAQRRHGLAAIDANGSLTDWDPDAQDGAQQLFAINRVHAVDVADGIVYAGGKFDSVSGEPRHRLAAIDTDGQLTDWDPKEPTFDTRAVRALAVRDDVIYVGGLLGRFGEVNRDHLAAVDTDGELVEWPDADRIVHTLKAGDDLIYVGGEFSMIGDDVRNTVAAIEPDGNVTNWNPGRGGTSYSLAVTDEVVYAGGSFSEMGAQERFSLAAVHVDGQVTDWDPRAYRVEDHRGTVEALTTYDETVYAGGWFNLIDDEPRKRLAAIDTDGNLTDWDPGTVPVSPGAAGEVHALAAVDGVIYIGGDFSGVGAHARAHFAAIDIDGNLPPE